MFKSEDNIRKIADIQEQQQAELLAKINETLINGGYFRARLNIDPFDKVKIKNNLKDTGWYVLGCSWQ